MSRLDSLVLALGLGLGVVACAGAGASMKPAAVVPATGPHAPDKNPFEGATLYVNPDYKATVDGLAAKHP
jgi:hypothetical protein